ncbi:uncharacterized protein LOC130978235 [Arachis stenosperma]|uniref:uncharacterized protein LOC130978235 n=1 Tax=Arachis stenosperma TaxID=217475 RepID=UPI0025AC8BAE|nr:uncharacterized protein LOC130978235 [Arachis stenosperma]
MVKKHNGKWRMCVDFTDLNKACPKNSYHLPSIDCLVDNASGFEKLSFMDAYSGYNQIQMHPSNQNKTAFITEYGNYCYKVMPFGLKNTGATYQRLMDKVFTKQLGRNIEVYIDDMVAKTKIGNNHLDDLTKIFGQLRKYNMRLNPEKCAFGVQSGKFLGFILTSRGIEANPEKCRAILEMTSPQTIKEVQRLTGRLAALSRFLPCLTSKSSCFFQTLKTKKAFQWTDECEQAFTTLKETLSKPPILHTPLQGEPLFLYLSVTNWAISSALVAEREKKQFPIYFTSKTLQNAELRYPSIEKLALALVFSARRLRPYFQSHEIHVRTDQPLRQVLQKPELAGRLFKWSVELSEFDIKYEGRASIKSQFLADFIVEFSIPNITENYIEWSLYVDGSSNPHGCGAGIILDDGHGNVIEHSLNFSFKASNNQSEYEALIAGLRLAADLNITELKHIPRESNGRADILSKLACTQPNRSSLYQSTLLNPSIELTHVLSITQEADWRSPYIQYLQTGVLPGDVENTHHFRRQASFFTIYNNFLYRRGFSRPLLKCLCRIEAELALTEAHEGICDDAKGLWAKLIPEIIWGYNTTIHSTTKETPFRLVYGSDAMIPVEISQSSLRTELADLTTQDIARQTELDLIEELRSSAAIKHLAMQQHIARRYNQRLQPRSFQIHDLVLRKTEQARKPPAHGKLAANWEGPYRVTKVIGNGAYRLQTLEGKDLPNTWNVSSLKLYYS